MWFYIGIIMHRVDNNMHNITSAFRGKENRDTRRLNGRRRREG
jgi:hypothetical protein